MNREIKFRVWDINKKCWVKYLTYCIDDFSTTNKDWHIVTQYTGLKDKNGREIYEGDILKSGNILLICVFIEGSFRLEYVGMDFNCLITNELLLEVIGNIYENPELLK